MTKDSKISRRSLMKVGMGAAATGLLSVNYLPPAVAATPAEEPGSVSSDRFSPEEKPIDYVNVLSGLHLWTTGH